MVHYRCKKISTFPFHLQSRKKYIYKQWNHAVCRSCSWKGAPSVNHLYTEGNAIFQDDRASIYRCSVALTAVKESFKNWIDPTIQTPKMADFWPIKKVWAVWNKYLRRTLRMYKSFDWRLPKFGMRFILTRNCVESSSNPYQTLLLLWLPSVQKETTGVLKLEYR